MATVKIGGRELTLPELNLKSIKRIWPLVEGINDTEDLLQLMDVGTKVLSIALERSDTPMTADEIEDALVGSEMLGVQKSVEDLLIESGLLQRGAGSGEAPRAEESPSTETGTASSQNSSQPDAPAETGN